MAILFVLLIWSGWRKSGSYGDLYITIRVAGHRDFKRAGYNIYLEQSISLLQAALGDTIEVPTLDGTVKLKIPEGIQSEPI